MLNYWLKPRGFAVGSVVKFRCDRMYNSVTALSDSDGEDVPPSQPRPQSKPSGKNENVKKTNNETSGV